MVAAQQLQNFRALIAAVARRIVQEAVNLLGVPCRLQRCLQADQLALEDLVVVAARCGVLLKEPTARAGDRRVFIKIAVVIQNKLIGKAVRFAEFIELCRRRPPIVMVPLQNDLPSGDAVDKCKILPRRVQPQRPGKVAEQDGRVLRLNDGQPLAQLLHISLPRAAKDVHRLIRAEGKMQISDCVQRHPFSSLQ